MTCKYAQPHSGKPCEYSDKYMQELGPICGCGPLCGDLAEYELDDKWYCRAHEEAAYLTKFAPLKGSTQ